MEQATERVELRDRVIHILGTAHISAESVRDVRALIGETKPDRVCVEIDAGRYRTMTEKRSWENLDIAKVLKSGQGFLLLANLVLSSFQRRLGSGFGVNPGDEMLEAVKASEEAGIPCEFCDREVQVTLKRAWAKSGLWNKSKLLASLISSAFSREELSEKELENLRTKSALDDMMGELADYLPSVKEVLIDERDRYLASKIYASGTGTVVAVLGAGHLKGTVEWLKKLDGGAPVDVSDIETVPPPGIASKIVGLAFPLLIVGLIVAGFFFSGANAGLAQVLNWVLWNGSLAALGCLVAGGHPLTILTGFFGAPIATLNPVVGVGLFTGLVELFVRKPKVQDFETLSEDIKSVKGFYRNKVTRALLVFFFSSVGGVIGNWIAIPVLTSSLFK